MNYDQFLENLSADIKAALEPELGALHIEIRDVEKLSGQSYTGLMIRKESENIAMSMNPEQEDNARFYGNTYKNTEGYVFMQIPLNRRADSADGGVSITM